MPELPEVEIVRRGVQRYVAGRTIDSVQVLHPRAVRRHLAGPADFAAASAGGRSPARGGAASTSGCRSATMRRCWPTSG